MSHFAKLGFFTLLAFLMASGTAGAGRMYKYTDAKGNIHFVDDYRKIPTKYREGTEKRRTRAQPAPAGPAAEGEAGNEAAAGAPSGFGPKGDVDLTGLPADVDPASVIGRKENGDFIIDPGRPQRLAEERKRQEAFEKKHKLGQVDNEGHDEAYWRQKMADCGARLRRLEENYRNVNIAYQEGPKFGNPGELAKVKKRKRAAESQQAECERIPKDARAAGAPPGWLR